MWNEHDFIICTVLVFVYCNICYFNYIIRWFSNKMISTLRFLYEINDMVGCTPIAKWSSFYWVIKFLYSYHLASKTTQELILQLNWENYSGQYFIPLIKLSYTSLNHMYNLGSGNVETQYNWFIDESHVQDGDILFYSI